MTTYRAGGDIDTYCTRCKLELAHVIIAMDATRPARVQCKTCRSEHAYRGSVGAKKKTAPAARSTSPRTPRAASAKSPTHVSGSYDELMQGRDLSRASRYKVSDRFNGGDVIDHKLFGFGMVTRLLSDDKIEVIFSAGVKVLAHGRA